MKQNGTDTMTESNSNTDERNDRPMIPPELSDTITAELDELNEMRETALRSTRKIIQLSSKIINAIHPGTASGDDLDRLQKKVVALLLETAEHPRVRFAPYIDSALGEYCEAFLFWYAVNDRPLPSHVELSVNPVPYLLGAGDAIGELRRYVLGRLKDGDVDNARKYYGRMEELYEFISGFHYPKAVVDIRRKRDVARSLLEKTLGELVVTCGNLEAARGRTG